LIDGELSMACAEVQSHGKKMVHKVAEVSPPNTEQDLAKIAMEGSPRDPVEFAATLLTGHVSAWGMSEV